MSTQPNIQVNQQVVTITPTAGKRYIARALEAYTTDNSSGVLDAWIGAGTLSS